MAYEKHTWSHGETISADLLNRMEDGIAEGGGGGSAGYSYTEIRTLITEESVTTETQAGWPDASGNMSKYISAAEIVVTFDGVEYTAIKTNDAYGAPWSDELGGRDWSDYPFNIFENQITTENAGTYSVKIEAVESEVQTTPGFESAVKKLCIKNVKDSPNNKGVIENNVTLDPNADGEPAINQATGYGSHAEGGYSDSDGAIMYSANVAEGVSSHAEGASTRATGIASHAEGLLTTAIGDNSHAEGSNCVAHGENSHAEGLGCNAYGTASHAEGQGTIAHEGQHVFGKYNQEALSQELEVVGMGTSDGMRKNARELSKEGNEWLAGRLTIGGGVLFLCDPNSDTKVRLDVETLNHLLQLLN